MNYGVMDRNCLAKGVSRQENKDHSTVKGFLVYGLAVESSAYWSK